MQTQYSEWLKTLRGRRADLPPVTRGLNMVHQLTYPANVASGTLRGSVKASPDATAELVNFNVTPGSFANGVTTWTFSLADGTGVNSTGNPALVGGDPDGVDVWIYDLLLTLPGEPTQRIAGGLFTVSGFVTEIS